MRVILRRAKRPGFTGYEPMGESRHPFFHQKAVVFVAVVCTMPVDSTQVALVAAKHGETLSVNASLSFPPLSHSLLFGNTTHLI